MCAEMFEILGNERYPETPLFDRAIDGSTQLFWKAIQYPLMSDLYISSPQQLPQTLRYFFHSASVPSPKITRQNTRTEVFILSKRKKPHPQQCNLPMNNSINNLMTAGPNISSSLSNFAKY